MRENEQAAMPPAWLRVAGGNSHLFMGTGFSQEALRQQGSMEREAIINNRLPL